MIQIADIKRTTYTANGVDFEMITVEKRAKEEGEYDFIMGDDNSKWDSEKPAHPVTFKTDFEIGKYLVTQELWEVVMGENPSWFKDKNRPVEQVSWSDICIGNKTKNIVAFLDKINAIPKIKVQNKIDGKKFRLPTEAQWEYAARGGKYWEAYNFEYAGSNHIKEIAWYDNNSHQTSKIVGLKMPNVLGLYDMSGNVREWCADDWCENYNGAPSDGTIWLSEKDEKFHVLRSGTWINPEDYCRVAYRGSSISNIRYFSLGFRLSRY